MRRLEKMRNLFLPSLALILAILPPAPPWTIFRRARGLPRNYNPAWPNPWRQICEKFPSILSGKGWTFRYALGEVIKVLWDSRGT